MSKRNFDIDFIDFEGNVVKEVVNGKEITIKLSRMIINSLLATYDDEKLSGEDKLKRYMLAERIKEGGVREYTIEELGLIKTLASKAFGVVPTVRIMKACEDDIIQCTESPENCPKTT